MAHAGDWNGLAHKSCLPSGSSPSQAANAWYFGRRFFHPPAGSPYCTKPWARGGGVKGIRGNANMELGEFPVFWFQGPKVLRLELSNIPFDASLISLSV